MQRSSPAKSHSEPPPGTPPRTPPPRRDLLTAFLAIVFGGLSGLIPLGAGVTMFLDPVLKRKVNGNNDAGHAPDAGKPFLRVTSLDSLPADGTPVQVPVIADLADAWNREVNQPIGAVYLSRRGNEVKCFNAICPHAGCFVAYSAERDLFQCPCHTSAFQEDGTRILPSPSPRNMDALAVDPERLKQGEVWVKFVNYYPGKESQEAKA